MMVSRAETARGREDNNDDKDREADCEREVAERVCVDSEGKMRSSDGYGRGLEAGGKNESRDAGMRCTVGTFPF
jgi:hypothetical protein